MNTTFKLTIIGLAFIAGIFPAYCGELEMGSVSVTSVCSKAQFYDKKIITVVGCAGFGSRRDSVLVDSEAALRHRAGPSISLFVSPEAWTEVVKIRQRWISIRGECRVDQKGFVSMSIEDFAAIQPLTTKEEEDRAVILKQIGRREALLEIQAGNLKLGSKNELEASLKESRAALRYFDLTGTTPWLPGSVK